MSEAPAGEQRKSEWGLTGRVGQRRLEQGADLLLRLARHPGHDLGRADLEEGYAELAGDAVRQQSLA